MKNNFLVTFVLTVLIVTGAVGQVDDPDPMKVKRKTEKSKYPIYFGLQVKPVFPAKWIGTSTKVYDVENFHTEVRQITGYSLGGVVRVGLGKFIAIETGINTTQRRYQISSSVPDSSLSANQTIRFVTFDIPLSALFYIRMTEKFYMNVSIGGAFVFKGGYPRVRYNEPNTYHSFTHAALAKKVNFDISGNVGFEYRTPKAGIFYLGGAVRVPVQPLIYMKSSYEYKGKLLTNNPQDQGRIDGAYMSIEIKYFFPLTMKSKTPTFEKGPVEY